ncbi:MAG TPA: cytochrome c oxidase assembly protein [Phenylobacterium sp.]|jgi:putative membrane protein|nr:cytochrome c oxidase assembly protein [Phenylobacterium sp.]
MDSDIAAVDPRSAGLGAAVVQAATRLRGWTGAHLAIAGLGVALFGLSRAYPSRLPAWAPWDFSWVEFFAAALGLLWFFRGVARLPLAARPPIWRRVSFLLGIGSIYVVLQTRVDYFALHMFFLNRIQHVVMHHLGPLLIALGCGGATVKAGMPAPLRRLSEGKAFRGCLAVLQHPVVAPVLFVGLIYLWLIPAVHFRAMIDPRLYKVMNWSMVGDGLLFWSLVLDPRPRPLARLSFPIRGVLSIAVMFPQIALGALISFADRDLYPYYAFCGRLFPSISAITDQMIGGIVIWIPPAMMSVIGLLLVLNFMRLQEDRARPTAEEARMADMARLWTGR